MRKLLPLALCLVMLLTACARAEELQGTANGYGGELTVSVRKNGNDIVGIEVIRHNETESVAGPALEKIPQEILAKNSTQGVDVVTGATLTSNAILEAVNNAVGTPSAPAASTATATHMGLGTDFLGRIGPGTDDKNVPVYSYNVVMASALFDGEGRIVDIFIDQLEVATPNYDNATMPTFAGFPGQAGYGGAAENTEDTYLAQIAAWKTKRARGADYAMNSGTWSTQIDAFQRIFIGKTVDEVEQWFNMYCSDVNGRPLKADSAEEKDKTKYDALSQEDKDMLADVTTTATMSLNDSHGNILAAIRNAFDNRMPLSAEPMTNG